MGNANDLSAFQHQPRIEKKGWQQLIFIGLALSCLFATLPSSLFPSAAFKQSAIQLTRSQQVIFKASVDRCKALHIPSGPPSNFSRRSRSDRAIEGSAPILIRNVTLWTGQPEEGDGLGEVRKAVDVYVSNGIIQSIESTGQHSLSGHDIIIDANGAWMTPGIIDVHVHVGLDVLPALSGLDDTNSRKSPTTPALRSIDGVSNHDWGFVSLASGGITSGLALPGSANNVGGQAFPIKMGRLGKKATSLGGWTRVIDPPRTLIMPGEGEKSRDDLYTEETGMKRVDGSSSFRYMKMACGENARKIYGQVRLDEAYQFRGLFDRARSLKQKQDAFCDKALFNNGQSLQEDVIFPDDLALEAVVDILRGKVKVNTHCYTLEDFSSFVSHTNEFKFPLAAFHHSHEAYLVPDLLKKVYGGPPAVAMFSVNANYKTEAYFGSPFAAPILAANNITTLTKSDHPVTDSRRLMKQVAEVHHYGLSAGKSLRGVTSSAAKVLGLDHRIGQIKSGFDADLVLWNKHPLLLGAKPLEVIIDGTRQQLKVDDSQQASVLHRANEEGILPHPANYEAEIKRVADSGPEIVAWETTGFPVAKRRISSVRLFNVTQVFSISGERGNKKIKSSRIQHNESVLLSDGRVSCIGDNTACPDAATAGEHINLKGGTVIPGILAFGSNLGLTDINAEAATKDGSSEAMINSNTARAIDGLRLGGNDLRFAHSSGVRSVISAPESKAGLKQGIATLFDAGVEDLFEEGAIRKSEVALHLTIDHWQASLSSQPTLGQQIASIRLALKKANDQLQRGYEKTEDDGKDNDDIWKKVASGSLPLIVNAKQAETLAQLIFIKEAYPDVKLIISGADEASFGSLPSRLKQADIPVLIRPFEWPQTYDSRRALKLGGVQASRTESPTSLLGVLLNHGVKTGLKIDEAFEGVTLLWDAIAAVQEAGTSHEKALELITTSLADILNIDLGDDCVAFDGSPFEYGARPVAISTPRGVDLMDD